MSRDIVNTHCATLPGAERSDPWGGGHDCWKVGGKVFALIGAQHNLGVSVKCRDSEAAHLLIEIGQAERAPYLHRSWVRIPWGVLEADDLRHRLDMSYDFIRAKLPKKVQTALAPR
ncbi:MmcQ/YjbR family DNA-binding protein [Thioclava sp.]|uniref:MmcQ/YjbR family DNA-binding protein n=1 Tax=Thioclava sp. TaxID=1933450 RepID=UPI003AA7D1F6